MNLFSGLPQSHSVITTTTYELLRKYSGSSAASVHEQACSETMDDVTLNRSYKVIH